MRHGVVYHLFGGFSFRAHRGQSTRLISSSVSGVKAASVAMLISRPHRVLHPSVLACHFVHSGSSNGLRPFVRVAHRQACKSAEPSRCSEPGAPSGSAAFLIVLCDFLISRRVADRGRSAIACFLLASRLCIFLHHHLSPRLSRQCRIARASVFHAISA